MSLKKIIFFFISLLFSATLFAQSITGTIYEEDTLLSFIQVANVTQNLKAYSNEEGIFVIEAAVNDILLVLSPSHIPKKIIAEDIHFKEMLEVKLELNTNSLEEVVVKSNTFDEDEYNKNIQDQIKEDVDKNAPAYDTPSNGQMDFIKIYKLIAKKLKKNKDLETQLTQYISYKDLQLLLSNDDGSSNELTAEILEIKDQNVPLFIDYCRGKIEQRLLKPENNLLLFDALLNLAEQFKML